MSRRAIRDLSEGRNSFQNETEELAGYRLLQESINTKEFKKYDSLQQVAKEVNDME